MKEQIIYLKQNLFEAKKYTTAGVVEINSIRNEIDKLAEMHLFSMESYKKAAKKKMSFKNKIPIYFSNKLLLFYIKSKDEKFYLNFKEIFKVCFNKKIVILFKNGDILELEVSKKTIANELVKVKTISNYINNLL